MPSRGGRSNATPTAPHGPRGRPNYGSAGGGIQKRRSTGPLGGRTDRDGDLEMSRPSESSAPGSSLPRSSGSRGSRRNNNGIGGKTLQAINRHIRGDERSDSVRIANQDSKGHRSDITWLRVRGLRQSKAASNPDGGLKDLIGFLERKAAFHHNRRAVTIKKVSL